MSHIKLCADIVFRGGNTFHMPLWTLQHLPALRSAIIIAFNRINISEYK